VLRLSDVTSAPIPFDPARGQHALASFDGLPQNLLALIKGVAGCSPYLEGSLAREATWLRAIHDQPLTDVFIDILKIEGDSFQTLSDNLRIAKRRAALLIALADLGGVWNLKQVTKALTDLADTAVQKALEFLVGAEIARGKLPGCGPEDISQAAGMVALAMGKMGAHELNYSSDIDLIILFDESRFPAENYAELRAGFIRITKRMVKLLSENTTQGYVFRTDLRLRPDPSVTPVCVSMEAAERYYESVGRTWERAAFIKARPCAGAIDAGRAFLERLSPFIWRKHLDFAAIEDAHDMRLRIREHKGLHGPIVISGHDMKLGRGGIREIEFFAQTRQVIVGGRDPELRSRETLQALKDLSIKGWINPAAASKLAVAYEAHRLIEHRIQMIDDAQTHIMPDDIAKRARLAAFCGFTEREEFEASVIAHLETVHEITESFFASDADQPERPLDDYGFRNPEAVQALMEKWQDYAALRSNRAQRIFARLQPSLLTKLSAASNPNEALIHFDGFLARLPAGVQVFSLFDANPELLDLLVDICTTAPELARYLGQNARVLDFVLGQEFFQPLSNMAALETELAVLVDGADDYESVLDTVRIWVHEQRFRVGVHLLRGLSTATEASGAYSDVAEACLKVLWAAVTNNFSLRYGPPPGKGAAVIAMGKLGSREMTVTSDLDLIVIYDADGLEMSTGQRVLAIKPYYARLTQAFVSALTVATAKGTLYKVDMRLRPSGRSGPVATSLSGFISYQNTEAWVWEHMALLRARVVTGSQSVIVSTKSAIAGILDLPRDQGKILVAVQEMRQRLAQAKAKDASSPWEVKFGQGRLMDVELLLQAGMLIKGIQGFRRPKDMVGTLVRAQWLSASEAENIIRALELYTILQQISRLAVEGGFTPEKAGRGVMSLVLKATGKNSIDILLTALQTAKTQMLEIINRCLPKITEAENGKTKTSK